MAENRDSTRGKASKPPNHLINNLRNLLVSACKSLWDIGRGNPRCFIHALKVGLALTLVSLLYLVEPLFKGLGQNAMWAVMTVVVVLEYTAGATLCKGFNRGCGTICAGLLAFGIQEVAEQSEKVSRAVLIGGSVFLVGSMATYLRFVPHIKKNYDYGVVIFLLTFNLISVSSYRVHDVLGLARYRFYTIIIGCMICLAMSLLILPNWSGDDLNNATINKLEGLAKTIEASVNEYFRDEDTKLTIENAPGDPTDRDYRAILDSKSNDETLAFFASWEPRCTRNFHRYPWKQYVKIGVALRHFGYTAIALHGCLDSQIQAPRSIRALFQDPCSRVAEEVSKVLAELAISIKKSCCSSYDTLRDQLNEALQDLNSAIKSQPRSFLGNNNTNEAIIDKSNKNASSGVIQTSIESETDTPTDSRSTRIEDQSKDSIQQKQLRPTLSKIAITSLEFSETLPFAAFLSLLVEMVARLDLVIEEVEILGRSAGFKKFVTRDDVASNLSCTDKGRIENVTEFQNYNLATQVGE